MSKNEFAGGFDTSARFQVEYPIFGGTAKSANDQEKARAINELYVAEEQLRVCLEACKEIAKQWLEVNPVRFVDEKTRQAFIQHVARDSGGLPIAIEGMLENARTLDEITMNKVRELSHDAAVQYFDMSYVLFGLLVGFMALRYVSRGIDETELMVLSGVGSAVMIGFLYAMRFLRSSEKR